MRDVIWTIIAIWVIYQVYKVIRSSRVYVYQKHDHSRSSQHDAQKEGQIKVDRQKETTERKPNLDKGGEYVDFEEIKD